MSGMAEINTVQRLISDIDHLITEMLQVRRRVADLAGNGQPPAPLRSVREAEWFGMWADRDEMQGLSSREWLTQLRNQQWAR
ncbi:MAG: hypothetical protein ONB46_07770 [candidate division KSB1 bacterium]|nr:hypothetical protein [candidate division KSB1 bacterium]MDZ7365493.1 hypothetical protein [candidate division KSB1 bacterium]MDZ7403596.1 hypothetical protein [candidate division KSB1 bacterium]